VIAWVSPGSVVATLTLPFVAILAGARPQMVVAAIGTAALILFRHRDRRPLAPRRGGADE
jgi:hypothetical protein